MKKILCILLILLSSCQQHIIEDWLLVSDQSIINIQLNQAFNPYDYINQYVPYEDLVVENNVNQNKVGTYTVIYTYKQMVKTIIVVVASNEPNIITLDHCVDGDTAVFNEIGSVRFLYINTPESTNKIEPYGKEASAFTCDLLSRAKVIRYELDGPLKDKYNRTLAWIFIDDVLIQEVIAKEGYVVSFYDYGTYRYEQRVIDANNKAKDEHKHVHLNQ